MDLLSGAQFSPGSSQAVKGISGQNETFKGIFWDKLRTYFWLDCSWLFRQIVEEFFGPIVDFFHFRWF